ncbi:hypothetical protein C2U70_15370 [Bradyrhizobium guangdongense]|uniref:hypothetical protein n=1 Tax=Bradyrhizobium guangdongense TaxID=1325090 RepID=UPI00112EE409|nr:hypothetical protein [Bradyrhizobium guangdongense]TPQ35152.1 hypothetical protein C2U70_15370 [Bradyrhizobium guangdongense]
MNNRLLTGLVAATVAATLAVASPVLARGGGGGGHGGFGGGMRGGGMHMGGAHVGGAHFGGARFAGPAMGHAAFGPRFAGAPMARAAFAPRFAGAGWHGHHHGVFRHHRFHRFAFIGAPAIYAGYYDGCWRRAPTPYGWQWVNVCGDYWY